MTGNDYKDIILEIRGQIGTIRLNRPKSLNSFGGDLMTETISALRILNEHPDTIITVLTGEGRFFSAGADMRTINMNPSVNGNGGIGEQQQEQAQSARKKIAYMSLFAAHIEMLRSIIDHRKVFVLALNGPGVGGGAAWFTGVADIVLASADCYLQVPFSALGLVPELGSAPIFAQSMGVHRASEFLMFGQRLDARELKAAGLVNRIFPVEDFQNEILTYLSSVLEASDGRSLMEAKRLINRPLREGRLVAVMDSVDALAERFVEGAPKERFELKRKELEEKSRRRSSKL
ncbi:BgTH12-05041 [Blumeria graminis f. sp. triticale]|uniref:BgtA-20983 n=3 Tax=Blumeria graminis TaxID=34373 RepID=A0A0P0G513_BLUGR|nr:BgtA-20983 [Blumeria graminis f. sp. tritici]EPQ62947.1 hypothetical protein BGT96224_A20983 [Blumeria graminis f. sp. tritici 96224]CAD6502449.1 BgTH12-05041 [Blumeria graminis f. sp. triticale]VDB87747.1 BgtA-20983 [Blumeria graminis f. sp. tritici]